MKTRVKVWGGVVVLMAAIATGYAQDPGATAPVTLSPAASAVVSMAEAGQGDDAQMAYVQSSQTPFNLSADDVIYLRDVGLSSAVITAMLNHDKALPATAVQPPPQYNYTQQPYPPTVPPPATDVPPPADVTSGAPPPTYVSDAPADVSYFYSSLEPYGAWVNLDGYGWCWQPRTVVINRGWRPYCDGGHWVWTDAGWFWQSDYSWGWAPFHYGRWVLHPRNGWVWFPDRTWGPAWVSWRSSGDYCGWAPLPLHADFVVGSGFRFNGVSVGVGFDFGLRADLFTFVGLGDFAGRDLVHRRLAPAEVNRFYSKTTIINNYTVDKNRMVINHGIPVDRVSAASHRQIRTVSVRTAPAGSSPKSSGSVVYRHELQAPSRPAKVVAQKVDDRHPTIQHTPSVASSRTPSRSASTPAYPQGRSQKEAAPPQQRPYAGTSPSKPQKYAETSPRTPEVSPTLPLQRPTQQIGIPKAAERSFTPPVSNPSRTPSTLQTRPESEAQPSHFYSPKSYNQAAAVHSLPPVNQPPSNGTRTQVGPGGGAPLQSPKGSSGGGQGQRQPH